MNLLRHIINFSTIFTMAQSRQLAAIMFTDIVGYTALMGEDEKKAFEMLRKNRQLQKPLIEEYNGKWIKELGDGVLASFQTVTDAAGCALKIQQACSIINDLKLRIGIHLGEVVFEDNDVFGDGVNIASRLQALAPIGGIFISETVFRNIENQKDIKTEFVREEILKNVKHPVKIYQLKSQGHHVADEFAYHECRNNIIRLHLRHASGYEQGSSGQRHKRINQYQQLTLPSFFFHLVA